MYSEIIPNHSNGAFNFVASALRGYRLGLDVETLAHVSLFLEANEIEQYYFQSREVFTKSDPWLHDRMARGRAKNLQRNQHLLNETKILLRHAHERGFDMILLKGISFISHLYEIKSIRYISDVDVLVKPENIATLVQCLRELGYTTLIDGREDLPRLDKFEAYNDCTNVQVDVHTQLCPNSAYLKEYVLLDGDEVWEKSLPLDLDGIRARRLSLEHEFLYSFVHMFFHNSNRFNPKWMFDIDHLLEKYGEQLDKVRVRWFLESNGLVKSFSAFSALFEWMFAKDLVKYFGLKPRALSPCEKIWLRWHVDPVRIFGAGGKSYRQPMAGYLGTILKFSYLDKTSAKLRFVRDHLLPSFDRAMYAYSYKLWLPPRIFYAVVLVMSALLLPFMAMIFMVAYLALMILVLRDSASPC